MEDSIMMSHVLIADPFPRIQTAQDWKQPPPQALNFVAASVAAALSSSLYNPLDCLRVRWQVLPEGSGEKSLVRYGIKVIRQDGLVEGLWKPGLTANAWGMGLSSGIRFGFYEQVRNAFVDGDEKSYQHMVLAGFVTGCLGYVATTPFHLLKTTIQADRATRREPYVTDLLSGIQRIVREQGLASLYRGAIPLSFRGSLFTAGQLLGYDGMKTLSKSHGYQDDVFLHVVSGISASFWASLLSCPADLVMAKYMSTSSRSLAQCIRDIYTQNGGSILGFWRGWTVFFVRLTPSLLTFSTVYEQLRHSLGLGYFE